MTTGRIEDLPVAARDALSFPTTQAGVGDAGNFNGGLKGWLNTSVDGIITTSPYSNNGIFNPFFLSTDLVRELRVVTSPADAELGRGSGQIMVATRSGTNDFHGSLFDTHRNTALNANTWFNNLNGVARNVLIRNQFGGRLGGPVIRNKTFFFFLYDGQREVTKELRNLDDIYEHRRGKEFSDSFPACKTETSMPRFPLSTSLAIRSKPPRSAISNRSTCSAVIRTGQSSIPREPFKIC